MVTVWDRVLSKHSSANSAALWLLEQERRERPLRRDLPSRFCLITPTTNLHNMLNKADASTSSRITSANPIDLAVPNLFEFSGNTADCLFGGVPCGFLRPVALSGIILGSCSSALILKVSPELLKTERTVGTREEIDETFMVIVSNAQEDYTAWINSHRHGRSKPPLSPEFIWAMVRCLRRLNPPYRSGLHRFVSNCGRSDPAALCQKSPAHAANLA